MPPTDGAAAVDREQGAAAEASAAISATDRLRDAILTGAHKPGERINEVHLSRALGVSRTPTRAALHALSAEGLVDYTRNRGFTVRAFEAKAMLEAYEIRGSLEGLACRFAAERGLTDECRAAIEQALRAGEKVLGSKKLTEAHLDAYREMNVAFHDAVLAAARNRMLADAVRLTLNMPGASSRRIVAFNYDDVRRRHDDHHRIYELIVAGEGWRAEMMMREHVVGLARSRG